MNGITIKSTATKFRIYNNELNSFWGIITADAAKPSASIYGWISLEDKKAWGDSCVFDNPNVFIQVQKQCQTASMLKQI